jgi:hypothetical protein
MRPLSFSRLVSIFLITSLSAIGLRAGSIPEDQNWEDGFVVAPGVNGRVFATAVIGQDLYVAGTFSAAGTNAIQSLARWDGEKWHAVGDPLNGPVTCLAVQNTNLIVGGQFTMAGSVAATNIARWTGQGWEALGSGLSESPGFGSGVYGATVWSLAVSENKVYAGGTFDSAGGIGVKCVAMWNGTNWSSLGTGVDSEIGDPEGSYDPTVVWALTLYGQDLYAGGVFIKAGGESATNIARWDGTQWSPLDSGVSGGDVGFMVNGEIRSGWVNSVALDGDRLYAGGQFTNAGSLHVNNFAIWTANGWENAKRDFDGPPAKILPSGKQIYLGGSFTSSRHRRLNNIAWGNTKIWVPVGRGVNNSVLALSKIDNRLYAGGDFDIAGKMNASSIAMWNGKKWSPLGSGKGNTIVDQSSYPGLIAAAIGSNFYVAGEFRKAGEKKVQNIAKWNGTNWSGLGSGVPGQITQMTTVGSNLYVAGDFVFPKIGARNIARWNGKKWSALNKPFVGAQIDRITAGGTDLFVQAFTNSAYGEPLQIYKWDGKQWTSIPAPEFVNLSINYWVANADNLYLAGSYSPDFSSSIIRWDGTNWSVLEADFEGSYGGASIVTMAVKDNELYVGGAFEKIRGQTITNLARWDGTNWSDVGNAFDNRESYIYSMISAGDSFYIAGSFNRAGGIAANNIARWDGQNWHSLGSGLTDPVSYNSIYIPSLAVSGNKVCAVGNFTHAGGKPSHHFAIWTEP